MTNLTEKAQDVQKNCLSLTEAWKNGELEVGEYYLRYKDGTIDREYYDYVRLYEMVTLKGFSTEDCEISEILAPVPSYDHFVELTEKDKENAKLKDLLKECRDVSEFTKTIVNKHKWLNEVITKIDEVLK